ncbi:MULTISPECIES: hypothetical protein [Natrialbaceae]|uniref:hypothetical protein n=1 Tax=Natrialbaceae TaxID=1644061 RepID=UPI00207D2586|nr:hypothetical protein [Natronococcus sp. CG52]
MGTSTAEAEIFLPLADWLDDRGYDFFVHVPEVHQSREGYSRLYDQYPSHSVSIGPYKPDVLGYTPSNRVFAIEVKGTENLRKGLGQAISYQRGVDHAYLAADRTKLNRVHDLALSKGIGVFEVDRDVRDVAEKHPYAAEMKDLQHAPSAGEHVRDWQPAITATPELHQSAEPVDVGGRDRWTRSNHQ